MGCNSKERKNDIISSGSEYINGCFNDHNEVLSVLFRSYSGETNRSFTNWRRTSTTYTINYIRCFMYTYVEVAYGKLS